MLRSGAHLLLQNCTPPCRLGVGKVYLWDHASDPPMKEIVQVGCM